MSKEKVVAIIRACARALGHRPTLGDLHRFPGFSERELYRYFPGLADALRAAGIDAEPRCVKTPDATMLLNWAVVTRELKALPSVAQYRRSGRSGVKPFLRRFGSWRNVPAAFRVFVRKQGIEEQWRDVLNLIRVSQRRSRDRDPTVQQSWTGADCQTRATGRSFRRTHRDRPIYGTPLRLPGLMHAPVNEAGVIYLFALLARQLGFIVERLQNGFPDCEALCEIGPGRWQRVRIEFEFASRNFARHYHPSEGCDVIVCWIHDWPECPTKLEIVELSKVVMTGD